MHEFRMEFNRTHHAHVYIEVHQGYLVHVSFQLLLREISMVWSKNTVFTSTFWGGLCVLKGP